MKLDARQCLSNGKVIVIAIFHKIVQGVTFQEIAATYTAVLHKLLPVPFRRPAEYLLAYVLVHVYLLYTIIYATVKLIIRQTKVKGARIIPMLPDTTDWREKIGFFVTSLFFFHWLSSINLGASIGWHSFTTWVINLRPQINFKPQLVISKAESCHSAVSLAISKHNIFHVDADIDIFLTPESADVQEAMNKFNAASSTVSLISELTSPVVSGITRTESMDSQTSWESFLSDAVYRKELIDMSDSEIDIDLEMEKELIKKTKLENFDNPCVTMKCATEKVDHDLTPFKYNVVDCIKLTACNNGENKSDNANTYEDTAVFELFTEKSSVSSSEFSLQGSTITLEHRNQGIRKRVRNTNAESYI